MKHRTKETLLSFDKWKKTTELGKRVAIRQEYYQYARRTCLGIIICPKMYDQRKMV